MTDKLKIIAVDQDPVLTARDKFAMAALTGLLSNACADNRYSGTMSYATKDAYEIADAMLKSRQGT